MAPNWSPSHAVKVLALMTNDLFPYIGVRPLAEVTAPELLMPRAALRQEVLSKPRIGR